MSVHHQLVRNFSEICFFEYRSSIRNVTLANSLGYHRFVLERAGEALTDIGPAVVHGGFSTFLAFIFLAGSESYVFSTFFKVSD